MQRIVDNCLAVTKESVKTITYESLNNILRLINGLSALLLAILPGKTSILEGIHGWELKPTFRGPRFPRWMENGVSSFNQFVHELSVDSALSVDKSSEDDIDDYYENDCMTPHTPFSARSHISRAWSFNRREKNRTHWIISIFKLLLLPTKIILKMPFYLYKIIFERGVMATPTTPGRRQTSHASKKALDHVVERATDRRRGVIEDLHLGLEICIETIFDGLHYAAQFLLSPLDSLRMLLRWSSSPSGMGKIKRNGSNASVPTATLADGDPTPNEKKSTFRNPLNTDARTCRDVITEFGYPYEAINVVTADGYVILLERIPRRDSKKVVYLQHGVFDSSMGWVSNGVVGSPAFAAFDQGYDVFLGNFRGLVSREHVDKNISSRKYWRYSINEHGTEDIPALIEKIHQVKTSELSSPTQPDPTHPNHNQPAPTSPNHNQPDPTRSNPDQPYKLSAICHSLGGAAIIMYTITRRLQKKPHRLSKLILLSPAGFHHDSPFLFTVIEHSFLWLAPILAPLFPGLYVPTRFFRMLVNKLARDLHNYPAVGGLVQTLMSYVVGGDSSNWVGVMGLPHYNMNDMPGVAFGVALHLAQIKRARRFVMFDYGSSSGNMRVYGEPRPLDLGECYGLIDVPVDLVAGRKDKVILPSMVRTHYRLMKEAQVDVSYKEFEYAHLDFTFSHREELLEYMMKRLMIVTTPGLKLKALRLKKLKA